MNIMMVVTLVLLCPLVLTYLEFQLTISTSASDISFNFPVKIDSKTYSLQFSLENSEEGIKYTKKKNSLARFKANSVEGQTLQGWKRFMKEVLYLSDRFYPKEMALDNIKAIQHSKPLSDGLVTFGPNLASNKFLMNLKEKYPQDISEQIISFYLGVKMQTVRVQIGGYESLNAKGHPSGAMFYEVDLEQSKNAWLLPVEKISCGRERDNHWQSINLSKENIKLILSIDSQFIVLPREFREEIERNFETESIDCSLQNQLSCKGMNSVDESLSFLTFQLRPNMLLNISLYDLRQSYDDKTKLSTYYLRLGDESQFQMGSVLLKNYYISLNLEKKTLMYSPLNRFPDDFITNVGVVRFLIITTVFMIVACLLVALWSKLSMKTRKRRHPEDIRLVAYQRADQQQD